MPVYDLDTVVEEWVPAYLGADAPLLGWIGSNSVLGTPQIYEFKAPRYGVPGDDPTTDPPTPPPPYVTFHPQSGGHTPIHAVKQGDSRVAGTGVWYVGVTVREDNLNLGRQVAGRLSTLLNGATGQLTTEGRIIAVTQVQTQLVWEEFEDGWAVHHRGALYRIIAEFYPH